MKYRKRPVVIEAFQMTKNAREVDGQIWPDWLIRAWQLERGAVGSVYPVRDGAVALGTREGPVCVFFGDWIIRGGLGELSVCEPGVFDATYEQVDETKRAN